MDDILTNAQKIENHLILIDKLIDEIPESSMEKANGIANYDRAIAITILKLKNGDITEMEDFNGETIFLDKLPATLIPQVAKGICYKEAFDKEMGEAAYKGIITMIEARKAQLNGLQSINKVLQ